MSVEVISRMHQHRMWVMGNLIKACELLTEEQLKQPFEIGQGTVWKSLTHMHGAEYVWLEALRGNPKGLCPGDLAGKLTGNQEGENPIRSIGELRERCSALDDEWTRYLETLTEEKLLETINRQSIQGLMGTTARDVLLHVCTHAHFTSAQVINMLRRLGVSPLPDSMLITMARQGL